MFIAMNAFKVLAGREEDFERAWRERESYLDTVPGFVQFTLLRRPGDREYISHTVWEDEEAFIAWTNSDAFAAGHRQGSAEGVLEGHPELKVYDALIVQTSERVVARPASRV